MKSGIYIIYDHTDNEFYIGSSYVTNARFTAHRSNLRKGNHSNYKLQQAFDLHHELTFSIIEFTKDTIVRENYYFDVLNPRLNIALDASAPMKGRKHSEDTIKKLTGREPWNRGIERTEEEKALMSKNRRATFQAMSQEEQQAWRESRKHVNHGRYWQGKTIPQVTRDKVRAGHLARTSAIICLNNGETYACQNDAAKALGIRQGHISEHLQGKRPHVKGYKFEKT